MFLTIIKTQLKYLDRSVTYQIPKKAKDLVEKKATPNDSVIASAPD